MTATAVPRSIPSSLLSAQVASLSRAAPYAVPTGGFDTGVIRLVSGAPAAEALPLSDYAHVAGTLLNDPVAGPEALGYGQHSGIPELREWIARPRRRQRRPGTGHQRWPARGFARPRGTAGARRLHRRRRPGVPGHHQNRRTAFRPGVAHPGRHERTGRRRARLATAVGAADQGAVHGARLPQSVRWRAAGRGPRPPGGTRRGIRIRDRLRQSLP